MRCGASRCLQAHSLEGTHSLTDLPRSPAPYNARSAPLRCNGMRCPAEETDRPTEGPNNFPCSLPCDARWMLREQGRVEVGGRWTEEDTTPPLSPPLSPPVPLPPFVLDGRSTSRPFRVPFPRPCRLGAESLQGSSTGCCRRPNYSAVMGLSVSCVLEPGARRCRYDIHFIRWIGGPEPC